MLRSRSHDVGRQFLDLTNFGGTDDKHRHIDLYMYDFLLISDSSGENDAFSVKASLSRQCRFYSLILYVLCTRERKLA